jgi:hypothetical protein
MSELEFNSWCRGSIVSAISDQACAKLSHNCNTASHVKKHDAVKVNHLYILASNSSESNPTRKLFKPSQFSESVPIDEINLTRKVIVEYNKKLVIGENTETEVTDLFLEMISELLLKKVEHATEDEGSQKFMDDQSSLVMVDANDDEEFDFEIRNMMTASENLEDEKIPDEKNSSVIRGSNEMGTNAIPSGPTLKESKLTVDTSKLGDLEDITRSVSAVEEGSRKLRKSPKSTTLNSNFSTSKEFMLRMQNSTDGGAAMLEALCQKVLTLETYTRNKIRPKVLSNVKKIKEVEEGFNVLFNPAHPTQRLDSMQLQLDGIEENMEDVYDKMDENRPDQVASIQVEVQKHFAKELPNLQNKLASEISKSNVIKILQRELISLKRQSSLTPTLLTSLRSDLTDLKSKVDTLSGSLESSTNADGLRRSSLLIDESPNTLSNQELSDKVAEIKYQVTLMESRIGQEFLRFGNITLRSHADTCLFVNDHIPNNSFGCFFDLVALMNSPRDSQTDEKTFLDASYNAQRTKFLSMSEVSTSTSFLHVTPLVFCASHKQLHDSFVVHGSVDKLLPLVKNRASWSSKGGLFGMKRELERNISSKVDAINVEITATLGNGKAADLAKEYLRCSHGCFNDFVNWTENFFHELQAMACVSEEEAWSLILDCWMTFFIDLRKIRMECSSLSLAGLEADSDQRKEIVARYIWTMGRAIKLQDEFREKQFRNHPSISTVINFYLFSHKVSQASHDAQMVKVSDELKGIQGWRSSTTRDLNKLLKKT